MVTNAFTDPSDHLLIDAAPTVFVIRSFDVVPTLVGGLEARLHSYVGGSIDRLACRTLIETTTDHVAGELHVLVNSVVDSLDSIGIVYSKFGIPRRLDGLRYDAITYAQSIENELSAICRTISNQFILVVEVVVESWPVMPCLNR